VEASLHESEQRMYEFYEIVEFISEGPLKAASTTTNIY
jgi:hypothetical protein